MFDPSRPLERLVGETDESYTCLIEFWKMGDSRSVTALAKLLKTRWEETEDPTKKPAKLINYHALKAWSAKFQWIERAKLADRSKAGAVVDENFDDYLNSVNELRLKTKKFGDQAFVEAQEQMKAIAELRKKLEEQNELTATALQRLSSSLYTAIQSGELTVSIVSRSLGLEKIQEAILSNKENS